MLGRRTFLALAFIALPSLAHSQNLEWTRATPSFQIRTSLGATFLRADELVFDGNRKLSHLVWESTAPVLSVDMQFRFHERWSLMAAGSWGGFGDSNMVDYDWLYAAGSAPAQSDFDNWTDRSLHDDVRLRRYIDADLALGYDHIQNSNGFTLSTHIGAAYSDVRWKSYGGSYIYSSPGGFRDMVGTFNADEMGILYRQTHAQGFVGLSVKQEVGAWTLGATGRVGLALHNKDEDVYALRNILFLGDIDTAPAYRLKADVGYSWNEKLDLFLVGSFNRVKQKEGDLSSRPFVGSGGTTVFRDSAGASFQAATITGGFKYAF